MLGYIDRGHLRTYTCTRPVKFPLCHYVVSFLLEILLLELRKLYRETRELFEFQIKM